jgi:hypothetical protein
VKSWFQSNIWESRDERIACRNCSYGWGTSIFFSENLEVFVLVIAILGKTVSSGVNWLVQEAACFSLSAAYIKNECSSISTPFGHLHCRMHKHKDNVIFYLYYIYIILSGTSFMWSVSKEYNKNCRHFYKLLDNYTFNAKIKWSYTSTPPIGLHGAMLN